MRGPPIHPAILLRICRLTLESRGGQHLKQTQESQISFIAAYEEQAQSLFESYLDNAECYTTHSKIKDKVTKEERSPDEDFMRAIEEQIGITGSSRDGFRSDVTAYMFAKLRRGEKVNYVSCVVIRLDSCTVRGNKKRFFCFALIS